MHGPMNVKTTDLSYGRLHIELPFSNLTVTVAVTYKRTE